MDDNERDQQIFRMAQNLVLLPMNLTDEEIAGLAEIADDTPIRCNSPDLGGWLKATCAFVQRVRRGDQSARPAIIVTCKGTVRWLAAREENPFKRSRARSKNRHWQHSQIRW